MGTHKILTFATSYAPAKLQMPPHYNWNMRGVPPATGSRAEFGFVVVVVEAVAAAVAVQSFNFRPSPACLPRLFINAILNCYPYTDVTQQRKSFDWKYPKFAAQGLDKIHC